MPTRIFQVKKRIRSNYLRLAQKTLWLCLKYFAYMQTIGKMCLHQVRILTFLLCVLLLCCIIKSEKKTFLNHFLSTLDISLLFSETCDANFLFHSVHLNFLTLLFILKNKLFLPS